VILLSVGTQLPFDRLVRTVDQWAAATARKDVIAQIGPTDFHPTAMKSFAHIPYDRFRAMQQQCDLMVCHAGMGSIITAMEFGKPIIIMPRDHRLGEHRNAHQFATLRAFGNRPGIYPAENEQQLVDLLNRADELVASPSLSASAPLSFVQQLAGLVHVPSKQHAGSRLRRWLFTRRAGGL
jgi:UDP-N-acetylglucosamine transferase subunit ALG13